MSLLSTFYLPEIAIVMSSSKLFFRFMTMMRLIKRCDDLAVILNLRVTIGFSPAKFWGRNDQYGRLQDL